MVDHEHLNAEIADVAEQAVAHPQNVALWEDLLRLLTQRNPGLIPGQLRLWDSSELYSQQRTAASQRRGLLHVSELIGPGETAPEELKRLTDPGL
jgi:hypothetical protein